ncbi:MAG: malto-oligosyltrehalose synthase, partial [Chloroflexota bacterium]
DARSWPQFVHIATDGESYGHHHRHGDMALAYALHHIESNNPAKLTNYGEYLEKHPPTHEAQIFDNSSWSCLHGVERWKSDCGCNSGGHPDWNQGWRTPLREALDWLRDELAARFERRGRRLFRDPWAARDDYISIILDRSPDNFESYLKRHATRELNDIERIRALKLLEIQRQAMLMYTSCGWFFDELSGIETTQVMQYAGRAIQLAQDVHGDSLEETFRELLKKARSNIPEHRDGDHIYEKWVKPSLVDLKQVGAHYAMSSLFEDYGEQTNVYCYTVDREDYRQLSAGKVKLALGRANIRSRVTQESKRVSFGVLHLGDHNISGGVRDFLSDDVYESVAREVAETFARTDLTELIRVVDKHFGSHSYSLKLLFRDEQRKILRTILDSTLGDSEAVYRQVYEHHSPMMRFLSDLNAPPPKAWHAAAELVVNNDLRRAFESEDLDLEAVPGLLEEAGRWQLSLDEAGLGYRLRNALESRMKQLRSESELLQGFFLLEKMNEALDIVHMLPFEVDLWRVQNIYYEMLQTVPSTMVEGSRRHKETTQQWLDLFLSMGEKLGVRVMEIKESLIAKTPTIEAVIEEVAKRRRVPTATYRLQLNREFRFQDAREIIPYLHDLGISDCYTSPLLKARTGSSHGYDVCDHSQINPNLGSEDDFQSFTAELRNRGMGLLLDMVPNHMGIGEVSNSWWMDVLENGPGSLYANYFDIEWQPVKPELQNKVLLPILGDQYGKVLENGEFRLTFEDGAFFLYYYDIKLPIAPRTYSSILGYQLDTLAQALGEDSDQLRELRSILTAISYLPPRTELAYEKIEEHNREKEVIKRRISNLYQASAYVKAAIDTAVQAFNGTVGDARSFDLLDSLLDAQAYRPAFWRVATEEINYRRFFDINELAAIRMELPEVFRATHQVILRWLTEGKITGLRIDHPDGLWNPRSYLHQLQESSVLHQVQAQLGNEIPEEDLKKAVSSWFTHRCSRDGANERAWPLYVLAEKILSEGETLPADWPVDGTTGYEFLNALNGIFVNNANRVALDRVYRQFTGNDVNFRNLTNSSKKMIMLVSLASEVNALAHQLERLAAKNRLYRDFTLNSLTFALREVIAALPVYRTYITEDGSVSRQDEIYVETAVEEAKRRNPRTAASIFDFLRDTLLLRNLNDFKEDDRPPLIEL